MEWAPNAGGISGAAVMVVGFFVDQFVISEGSTTVDD